MAATLPLWRNSNWIRSNFNNILVESATPISNPGHARIAATVNLFFFSSNDKNPTTSTVHTMNEWIQWKKVNNLMRTTVWVVCSYCASPGMCALPLRRNGAHARFSIRNTNALRFKAKALPVDCRVALDLGSSPDCHNPCTVCDLFQSSIHKFIPFILFDHEASRTSG